MTSEVLPSKDDAASPLSLDFWRKEAVYYRQMYNDLLVDYRSLIAKPCSENQIVLCINCGPRPVSYFYDNGHGKQQRKALCKFCVKMRVKGGTTGMRQDNKN